jgi:thiopeptide-type bacteriocin biosynthesis protein
VILSLATWHFKKEDFVELLSTKSTDLLDKIQKFKHQWNLPKRFVLADYDNELLVNSENLLSIQIWIDSIKNREKIEIKEFFFEEENSIVKNKLGQGFTNQFIASFINENAVYQGLNDSLPEENLEIQRNFSVGSEWLYFKFYLGSKVADIVLIQAIKPLVEQLIEEQLIDKWFFIRYADPEKHLRFRVHLPDTNAIGEIFLRLKNFIQPFENEEVMWKMQVDSYQREIERYGSSVMELTESIFFEDSKAIIALLDQTWGEEREIIRWQWCLKLIDTYLTDFGLSLSEKKNLMDKMKTSFANEFNINKDLKLQLDQRFRNNRSVIEHILDNSLNETHEYAPLFDCICVKSVNTKHFITQIKTLKSENELIKYLSDTIHMTVNRTIGDNQRTHELVMYDFLFRYYQAETAKNKGK